MSAEASHFKIGVFVVTSVAILIGLLLMLGSLEQFQEKYIVETYMDEPIESLEKGSKVTWRGMKVGEVHSLGFVHAEYGRPRAWQDRDYRFVLVRMAVYPRLFGENWSRKEFEDFLVHQIDLGVRVKLVPPVLPGSAYVDMDYVGSGNATDEGDANGLNITWKPAYPYVPSIPSTVNRFVKAVEDLFTRVEEIDVQKLIDQINGVMQTLDGSLQELDIAEVQHSYIEVANAILEVATQTREIMNQVDKKAISKFVNDVTTTSGNFKEVSEDAKNQIEEVMDEFRKTSDNFNEVSKKIKEFIEDEKLKQGIEDVPEITGKVNQGLDELNALVTRGQGDIQVILDNLRTITENLREISEEAKRYPAGMLLGGPPVREGAEEERKR
jgi:ABC-type transporter Mla subunit MlaD